MDLEFIFIFIFSTRGEINEAINWPLSRFERKKRKIGAFKNRFCTTTAKAVCDLELIVVKVVINTNIFLYIL